MTLHARVAEFWHLLSARLALLAGRRDRARAALQNAIRRNPDRFTAHFLLARLLLREEAMVKARREFDLAWQIDPERFERCYARLRAQHDGAPDLFSYGRPPDRGVRVTTRAARTGYGDFRDDEERRRFEAMPPISRDEIGLIDWDRFEEEIFPD